MAAQSKLSVMLDSGAYSAWFHGAPLELGAYIEYCQSRKRLFDSIVALDKIPGSNRSAAKSSADVEQAARQSHENFTRMRKAGLGPIPVFHQGEDWSWLELMIKEGVKYIGISPYPRASQEHILRWLDEVFTRITLENGEPIVKTHGFGATSWGMITRYPWFSIDSTTWALAAGYGTIIMPPFITRGFDTKPIANYTHPPLRFSITDRQTAGSRPLLRQGPLVQSLVSDYADQAGTSIAEIANSDRFRAQLNAFYYCRLEASLGCTPFAYPRAGIRRPNKTLVGFNYRPRVLFAEQMGKHEYGRALDRVGARNRLISYYESRRFPDAELAIYCQHGVIPKILMRPKKPWSSAWIVHRRLGLISRLKEANPNE